MTHLLACPERGNDPLGDGNGVTRARVAACASLALLDHEGAEAAKLNSLALCKSITDRIQDRIDDLLDVTLIQMRILLGELHDQFGFEHIGRRFLVWPCFFGSCQSVRGPSSQ